MSDPAPQVMTLDSFLDWDDGTDSRYELVDGQPVAMVPLPLADARHPSP